MSYFLIRLQQEVTYGRISIVWKDCRHICIIDTISLQSSKLLAHKELNKSSSMSA